MRYEKPAFLSGKSRFCHVLIVTILFIDIFEKLFKRDWGEKRHNGVSMAVDVMEIGGIRLKPIQAVHNRSIDPCGCYLNESRA